MIFLLACASKEEPSSAAPPQAPPMEAPAQAEPSPKETPSAAAPVDTFIRLSDFETPESVLYDSNFDRYIVSNINGAPLEKDNNGYLSLVSPEGKIISKKWISGSDETFELHAPKGSALLKGKLYVADIDTVRVFSAESGALITTIPIEGAQFLNDLYATGNELYLSDTQRGTLHRISEDGLPMLIAEKLSSPNGIAARGQKLYVASFSSPQLTVLTKEGSVLEELPLSSGGLDGLVMTIDGSAYLSSWDSSSIIKRTPSGELSTLIEELDAPADIGLDSKRNRLLIPLFKQNEVLILPLKKEGSQQKSKAH
jgi:hypothetical protein